MPYEAPARRRLEPLGSRAVIKQPNMSDALGLRDRAMFETLLP
jgi:hypothetical protein